MTLPGCRTSIVAGAALAAATFNATIVEHGRCGSFGTYAYVQNLLADQPVKATISAVRRVGDVEKTSQRVVRILPGKEVRLGCSEGSAGLKNEFTVIGSEP